MKDFKIKVGDETTRVSFGNYGQERDLICTEPERDIFDTVRSLCDDVNLDADLLQLVRVSDNYVSIVMESGSGYGLLDVLRMKYTNRAKWIKIAPRFSKIDIDDPEDIVEYADEIRDAYRQNVQYL